MNEKGEKFSYKTLFGEAEWNVVKRRILFNVVHETPIVAKEKKSEIN
jgi:hypothetical protein